MSMPKIDLDRIDLTADERKLAERILNRGCLRASKPQISGTTKEVPYGRATIKVRVNDDFEGRAAYLWRMVAFMISPKSQHQCMPVSAEFDLSYDLPRSERKSIMAQLDKLADKIVDSVDRSQWHGVQRWGRALGAIA